MNQFYVDPAISRTAGNILGGLGQGLQQQREQQQAQEAMRQRVQQASEVFRSGNPDAISEFMVANPDMQSALEKAQQFKSEATKQKRIESLMRVIRGEPIAQVAGEAAEFIRAEGGDPTQTLETAAMPQEQAKKMAWIEAATLLPKDQYDALRRQFDFGESEDQDGSTAGIRDFEYYQNLKKTDPSAAKAFGQERGFVTKEGRELSGHLQKRLSTASDEAVEAGQNVGRYNVIADDIEAANLSGGLFGAKWTEALKEVTGTQDAVSDLRRKYSGIRASQVVNNLPPGAASDKDIEMAMSGFPSDKASGTQIASFMRGLAKLEQIRADYASFRADYISDKGHERELMKEWRKRRPEYKAETQQDRTVNWADM